MVAKITHIELDIREHQAFTSKNKYFLARNFLFRVLGMGCGWGSRKYFFEDPWNFDEL